MASAPGRECPIHGCRKRRVIGKPLCQGHEELYRAELARTGAIAYQEYVRQENKARETYPRVP